MRNRFWQISAKIFGTQTPKGKDEKVKILLKHGMAIYDAARACAISGSLDSNMSEIAPADLSEIFKTAKIKAVFANGTKAHEICVKHLQDEVIKNTGKNVIKLPSSSPANAKFSL
ncbi:hypothetical protein [Campylobacter mucosalis]|uniref:hypothetical protein n=1 Tax=Campylobacter mucosalis TaxID=202 RepID=UPI00325AE89E